DLRSRRARPRHPGRAWQPHTLRGPRPCRRQPAERRRQDLDPLQRARRGRHPLPDAPSLRHPSHRPDQDRVASAPRVSLGVHLLPGSEGTSRGASRAAGAGGGGAQRAAAEGPRLLSGRAASGDVGPGAVMDLRSLVPQWIRTLTPYPPGMPIEELERELGIRGSIKLASNENPLGPSPKALAAITAALGDLHRYPDGSAFYLKRRLAERLGVTADEIVVGNGSNEIIELVVRTFIRA